MGHALETCTKLQKRRSDLRINAYTFDDDVAPTYGTSPQDEVEKQLPPYAECDLFVLIMWARCGTPTGDAESGTIHEFRQAVRAQRESKRLQILSYFCNKDVPQDQLDGEQWNKVQKFKNEEVRPKGLLKEFESEGDFKSLIEDGVSLTLSRSAEAASEPPGASEAKRDSAVDRLYSDITEARLLISEDVYITPIVRSVRFERALGCDRLRMKLENLQVTGSFKVRGAFNALRLRCATGAALNFIACSAGNHAAGVAYALHCLAVKGACVRLFMPADTPLTKLDAIRPYVQDDDMVLTGDTFQDAMNACLEEQGRTHAEFIHPYNDLDVVAGRGTIGSEIINQWSWPKKPNCVIVPVGGGGLIAGIGTAIKKTPGWKEVRVIGVEPRNAASLSRCFRHDSPESVDVKPTLADGTAVPRIGENVLPIINRVVDEIWPVDEAWIWRAAVDLMENSRLIVEGAGALPLAAVLQARQRSEETFRGESILLVVSGGNLDMMAVSRIVQRGLVLNDRLAVFRFTVADRPGMLASITTALANQAANVLELTHSRLDADLAGGDADVVVRVETRDWAHAEHIQAKLRSEGFRVELLGREKLP